MEKLTAWWPDCTQDLSYHNSRNWPQRNGTSAPWNWRLTVPKTTKVILVRPLMIKLKMTIRDDYTVSTRNPPPTLSIKPLTPCLSEGSAFGQISATTTTPPSPVASIWNKANFLPTNLACLLAFEWWAARPPDADPLSGAVSPAPQSLRSWMPKRSQGGSFWLPKGTLLQWPFASNPWSKTCLH